VRIADPVSIRSTSWTRVETLLRSPLWIAAVRASRSATIS